jgi:stage III sporulation protein SpoIIIAA
VSRPTVALAVVRDTPPSVVVADDLGVLQRALAVRLVARTGPELIDQADRERLRAALEEERWSDALVSWIKHTGIAIDVYTERVLTDEDLPAELLGVQLQFSPLFRDT